MNRLDVVAKSGRGNDEDHRDAKNNTRVFQNLTRIASDVTAFSQKERDLNRQVSLFVTKITCWATFLGSKVDRK